MVKARINDSGVADLMLDTGAQVTIINPRVLAALGVGMRDAQRSTLRGVTGTAEAFAVSLESLEVAGARVGPLTIVSHDVGFDGDGLLGRDFLDRFTVTIDNRAGIVTLTPR
jgi:predicted aspartyl protease